MFADASFLSSGLSIFGAGSLPARSTHWRGAGWVLGLHCPFQTEESRQRLWEFPSALVLDDVQEDQGTWYTSTLYTPVPMFPAAFARTKLIIFEKAPN